MAADAAEIAEILNSLLATTTIEWTVTPRTTDDVLEWLGVHEVVLVAEDRGEVVGVRRSGGSAMWSSGRVTALPSRTPSTCEETDGVPAWAKPSCTRSSTRPAKPASTP